MKWAGVAAQDQQYWWCEQYVSGTTVLLHLLSCCCSFGLLVNSLLPLLWDAGAQSSSLVAASSDAPFGAYILKGVALGLGSIYVAGT